MRAKTRKTTRAGTTTPRRSPNPNGYQPSASPTLSFSFRTTFSSIDTITAEIVTRNGELVQRLSIDRHTGAMQLVPVQPAQ